MCIRDSFYNEHGRKIEEILQHRRKKGLPFVYPILATYRDLQKDAVAFAAWEATASIVYCARGRIIRLIRFDDIPFHNPENITSYAGDCLEEWKHRSEQRIDELHGVSSQYLLFGHRIAFLELFSGRMFIGVGVRGVRSVSYTHLTLPTKRIV